MARNVHQTWFRMAQKWLEMVENVRQRLIVWANNGLKWPESFPKWLVMMCQVGVLNTKKNWPGSGKNHIAAHI